MMMTLTWVGTAPAMTSLSLSLLPCPTHRPNPCSYPVFNKACLPGKKKSKEKPCIGLGVGVQQGKLPCQSGWKSSTGWPKYVRPVTHVGGKDGVSGLAQPLGSEPFDGRAQPRFSLLSLCGTAFQVNIKKKAKPSMNNSWPSEPNESFSKTKRSLPHYDEPCVKGTKTQD